MNSCLFVIPCSDQVAPLSGLHESLDMPAYDDQRLCWRLLASLWLDCACKSRDRPLLNRTYDPSKRPLSRLLVCRPY
jgi:hypothetical protein